MPVQIVYAPSRRPEGIATAGEPVLVLTRDNWNDYGIRTLFGAYLLQGTTQSPLGGLRVMAGTETATSDFLDKNPSSPIGGRTFDFGGLPYLALGSGLEFYSQLMELLPDKAEREDLLARLHDVVYLEHRQPMAPDLELRKSETFRVSLLRGMDETKAYGSARQLLFEDELDPNRFDFDLTVSTKRFGAPHQVQFRFAPDKVRVRPTNVTVLIGKNGLGKTVTLIQLVERLREQAAGRAGSAGGQADTSTISKHPPFRSVVAISYSPFETFPTGPVVPPPGELVPNQDAALPRYAYCGFRTPAGYWEGLGYAWQRTFDNLQAILQHEKDGHLYPGKPKFTHLLRVLAEGLQFDSVLVRVRADVPIPYEISDAQLVVGPDERYIDLRRAVERDVGPTLSYLQAAGTREQLYFRARDQIVTRFSAGQAMFVFMVVGAIAAIDRDSLLVIDEPELYLHPNLIVTYLRMLSTLLQLFESYAVVATHSTFVAREFPARNVRVFQQADRNRVLVSIPDIETFGADLSEIANLVFDNITVEKPYEQWLKTLVAGETSFESLKSRYGEYLNAESLTFLRNALADKTREGSGGSTP